MKPFAALVLTVIALLRVSAGAQDPQHPNVRCGFDGFDPKFALAEVSAASTDAYVLCPPGGTCQPDALKAGVPVVVYRTEGEWTCGAVAGGPGWVRSADLRVIAPDPNPPLAAFLGTWQTQSGTVTIGRSPAGTLALEGHASWDDGRGHSQRGDLKGEATPDGNRVHVVDPGSACVIDLALVGQYILAGDNQSCGGINIRFWGVWTRTALAAPADASPSSDQAPSLLNPASLHDTAPETFLAVFDTTAGTFVVKVHRAWAPHGADRFYNLVKYGFYNGCRFFRVVPGFAAQFGIHGSPAVSAAWASWRLPEDRALESNTRGRVTFAQGRLADTRTTQVFINYGDNSKLDIDNFAPFGEVVSSMVLVERIFNGYGEGPDQSEIQAMGNAFLARAYPNLTVIRTATIQP